jgi:hypothetical protein
MCPEQSVTYVSQVRDFLRELHDEERKIAQA